MRRDLLLWVAILIGPLVWFLNLCVGFALAPMACPAGWKPAMHVVAALSLVISAASGLAAWSIWRQVGREFPGEADGAISRSRALASGGVLLSAMFFLVILAQTIAEALMGSCQ